MPLPLLIPILSMAIPAAIEAIKAFFGSRKPPYIKRLVEQAFPLAVDRQLPVMAFVDAELMVFFPDGTTEHRGRGATPETAGPMVGGVIEQYGSSIMVLTIEPLTFKIIDGDSGDISIEAGEGGEAPWTLIAGGVLIAWLLLKRGR